MSESPLYDAWVADGRPWRLATPVKEIADKVKQALSDVDPVWLIGTIGDRAHLLAEPPQDHTPYSQTGWPVKHPYPYITAIDLMHKPALGLDCNKVFPHWLAAVKRGELPWLKYLIWQAKRYDVRNGWNPVSSSGHFDHMHASGRTDHINTSIGGFHPLPGYGDDMALKDEKLTIPFETLITGERLPATGTVESVDAATAVAFALRHAFAGRRSAEESLKVLWQLKAAAAADETRDTAAAAAITALTELVRSGGGDPDTTAILTRIDGAAAATMELVEQRHQVEMAELARLHAVALQERDAELAGLKAELDRLGVQ